jgi:hypothetical protein
MLGSGGGDSYEGYGSNGGGSVHLVVSDTLTLEGTISANGNSPMVYEFQPGGGSGGSVSSNLSSYSAQNILIKLN